MRRIASAVLIWSLTLGIITSCMPDKPNPEEILPGGRWMAAEATRDGRPTGTLTDLFFEFHPNDSLYTNIAGYELDMRYFVEDNIIQQRKGPFDADYAIESLTPVEMVVNTVLNGSSFRIKLVKRGK
jgi:hypothetical protein